MKNQDKIYKLLSDLKKAEAERKLISARIRNIRQAVDVLVANKELEFGSDE